MSSWMSYALRLFDFESSVIVSLRARRAGPLTTYREQVMQVAVV